jgi:hypothetical protein
MELVYPDYTRHDKRARNYRYRYDAEFKKYHWNDLSLKERDYWRGRVQQDEQDSIRKYEPGRFKKKKAQGPAQGRFKEEKKQEPYPSRT